MKSLQANGLEFSYLEYGEQSNTLMLCMHGFPDSAHTWTEFGLQFSSLGFHVVAPFMRGYAPTAIPADGAYSPQDLGQDVLAIIEALGYESAVVMGHDWGALAAYSAANIDPSRISKLITLAIPHSRSLKPSLSLMWKARHFLTFQVKGLARRSLSKAGGQGVDDIYRRWSPTWDFHESETAYIRDSFQDKARLNAALGYYWSFRSLSKDQRRMINRKTSVSTLCLVGDADGALDLSGMEKTPDCYTADYRYEIIPGVGHFPHREAPAEVFDHVKAFLMG